jgi:putative transposase
MVFNTFYKKSTNFLIPSFNLSQKFKKIINVMPPPKIIKDYEMKNTHFNIAKAKDEKNQCRAFATNIDFNENEPGLSDRLFYLYSKRWGIETSYRVKKNSFRAKTTSKNYHVRLFYFLFSVMMYNLWVIADLLIWVHLFGFIGEDHKITSKVFGMIFITVDPGG